MSGPKGQHYININSHKVFQYTFCTFLDTSSGLFVCFHEITKRSQTVNLHRNLLLISIQFNNLHSRKILSCTRVLYIMYEQPLKTKFIQNEMQIGTVQILEGAKEDAL